MGRIVHAEVEQSLVVHSDGVDLLHSAVAATHAGGKDQ